MNKTDGRVIREGMSGLDITIAVAMHKPYAHAEDTMYLPVHVGADLHPEVLTNIVGDNTGDNISQLNPYFSELCEFSVNKSHNGTIRVMVSIIIKYNGNGIPSVRHGFV